jgi:predicted transcriptional regulator
MELYDGKYAASFSRKQNKDDYLPKDIDNSSGATKTQKKSAKKAIYWLLAKAPHTIDEIADHFGMSSEMVKSLIIEFIRSGKLTKDTDPLRYRAIGH